MLLEESHRLHCKDLLPDLQAEQMGRVEVQLFLKMRAHLPHQAVGWEVTSPLLDVAALSHSDLLRLAVLEVVHVSERDEEVGSDPGNRSLHAHSNLVVDDLDVDHLVVGRSTDMDPDIVVVFVDHRSSPPIPHI